MGSLLASLARKKTPCVTFPLTVGGQGGKRAAFLKQVKRKPFQQNPEALPAQARKNKKNGLEVETAKCQTWGEGARVGKKKPRKGLEPAGKAAKLPLEGQLEREKKMTG